MDNPTIARDAAAERYAQLERHNDLLLRQNRWLKRLVASVVAGAGLLAFTGIATFTEAKANAARTLVAERFVLVDKNGKKRAVLGQEAVYGLTMLDEDEAPHAVLYANKETGRGFSLFADKYDGKKQVGIAQLPNGNSVLLFNDEAGKGRIMLATAEKDKPVLVLSDENGKALFSQSQP